MNYQVAHFESSIVFSCGSCNVCDPFSEIIVLLWNRIWGRQSEEAILFFIIFHLLIFICFKLGSILFVESNLSRNTLHLLFIVRLHSCKIYLSLYIYINIYRILDYFYINIIIIHFCLKYSSLYSFLFIISSSSFSFNSFQ
jgi:hypothetical protein